MKMIDTHCHLDSELFKDDLDLVIKRSCTAGVLGWIIPSLSFKNIPKVLALTERYKDCYAGVGIYPRYCKDWQATDIERVRQAAQNKKVVAIGEIGLDYMFNVKASRELQFDVLAAHLELAAELDLPVLLHNRDSQTYEDTLHLVKESSLVGRKRVGVLHHFTGDYGIAQRALDLGLYLSISGVITYPNAKKMPALVAKLPLDRLLLETDAPCMPPHPYRNTHRSEPAHVRVIAQAIAAICKKSLDEIAEITTQNAVRLFNLPDFLG